MSPIRRLLDGLTSHRYDRWLLLAILAVAAGFRLYRLDGFSIWRDEAQTIFLARHSFPAGILQALLRADVSPPVYYFLLHFWDRVFGSDWGLRFFSVIWGLGTIPLLYWVGRRISDRNVALLAALAAALSPHHIVVSRTVRMYTLLPMASLLAMYFAYRLVTVPSDGVHAREKRTVWWGTVLSSVLLLYTHNVGALLILSLNVFVVWEMLCRREVRARMVPWFTAQAAAAVSFLPWLPAFWHQLRSQGAVMGPWLAQQSRLSNALRLFNELTGLAVPAGRPWLWMAVVAMGVFVVRFRRGIVAFYLRFSAGLTLLLCAFFGPVILAALATPRSIGMIPSYVTLAAFPGMCFLIARGVNAVRPRALTALVLVVLCIVWVQTVSVHYVRRTSNLREIASYLSERVGSQDMIIIAPDYLASTFNYYFQGTQRQVAFPSALGRVEDITWVGWYDHWREAGQAIEPTLRYLAQELPDQAHLWLIAPLGAYPSDANFAQVRVLKARLDRAYGAPQVISGFPAAVESAEVYLYR